MFTGIIERMGRVTSLEFVRTNETNETTEARLLLETGYSDLTIGESVAVDGVCLTVAEFSKHDGIALFYLGPETIKATHFGTIRVGDFVNLERALTLQTRLSGHIVQGHCDGVAHLAQIETVTDCRTLTFRLDRSLSKYCVIKGSVALNGISLTLQGVSDGDTESEIKVMVIPHTLNHTNLSKLAVNDTVNVEIDILSKYLERLCQH